MNSESRSQIRQNRISECCSHPYQWDTFWDTWDPTCEQDVTTGHENTNLSLKCSKTYHEILQQSSPSSGTGTTTSKPLQFLRCIVSVALKCQQWLKCGKFHQFKPNRKPLCKIMEFYKLTDKRTNTHTNKTAQEETCQLLFIFVCRVLQFRGKKGCSCRA